MEAVSPICAAIGRPDFRAQGRLPGLNLDGRRIEDGMRVFEATKHLLRIDRLRAVQRYEEGDRRVALANERTDGGTLARVARTRLLRLSEIFPIDSIQG